jgi:hypothetical protein
MGESEISTDKTVSDDGTVLYTAGELAMINRKKNKTNLQNIEKILFQSIRVLGRRKICIPAQKQEESREIRVTLCQLFN